MSLASQSGWIPHYRKLKGLTRCYSPLTASWGYPPNRSQGVRGPIVLSMSSRRADVWVVAGPPGGGKTTVAGVLLSLLTRTPALLDKDTMYGRFVEATLSSAGRPIGEREGSWYDSHVKIHEYGGMTDVAREIRSRGCPVLLSAPFTNHIHDPGMWRSWVQQLGGETVRLLWVRSDAASVHHNLETRQSDRDAWKLAHFGEFIASMHLDREPTIPHVAIDNRLSASTTIEAQLRAALHSWGVAGKRKPPVAARGL
jgi:predicted kinase